MKNDFKLHISLWNASVTDVPCRQIQRQNTVSKVSNYRTLSWLCMAGTLAFYVWITIAPFGFPGAPLAALIMLGLLWATLSLGRKISVDYWHAVSEPDQAPRVMLMIVAIIIVQLLIGAVLICLGQLNWLSTMIASFVVWAGMPLGALWLGWVRWPVRKASPQRVDFLVVAVCAIVVAAIVCGFASIPTEGPRVGASIGTLTVSAIVLTVAATMEEVVFRVLLLTALVQATRSRMQALVLLSAFFALCHVPLALEQPAIAMDWALLSEAAKAFWPEMVWKLGFGFLFGALWIRSGSLALIAGVHALANLGEVLQVGLYGWSSL